MWTSAANTDALAGELADSNAAVETASAHNRVAIGHLRTGNTDLVSLKIDRLRVNGLVSTRRDGKTIYYSLTNAEARVVIGAIYEVFCRKPRKS